MVKDCITIVIGGNAKVRIKIPNKQFIICNYSIIGWFVFTAYGPYDSFGLGKVFQEITLM